MRASLKQAVFVLAATFVLATPFVSATPAAAQGWQGGYESSGPVFDGPASDGPYYTGPYKGVHARLAYPDEARCLMVRRPRDPSYWSWEGGSDWAWFGYWRSGSYTTRVCRR